MPELFPDQSCRAFVELLRAEFKKRLFTKTGWGCNQIWDNFNEACIAALEEFNDYCIVKEKEAEYKTEEKNK